MTSHPMCPQSKRFLLTQVFLLATLLAVAAGCEKKKAPAAAAHERPPALVTAAQVVSRDVPVYLDEIGRCVAREVVSIQPQVEGRIMDIHFKDGATIKKGDLLFTIDPRPYEAELAREVAAVEESKASLDLARTEFARIESMLAVHAASQSEFDVSKSAVAVAEAKIQSALAAVEIAKLNLNYCYINSPVAGRAGQRLVDVGNVVKADGNSSLLVIQALDPIYADFTVTEGELPRVRERMSGGVLKTLVRLPDDAEPREGKLTFLDNAVQDATGTVRLRATLPNADDHFWPGQFVHVRLVLSVIENATLVPGQSTQLGQQGPYVYVIKPDSTAELRPVKLGQRQGDLVTVTEGLHAGEIVVLSGHMGVMPGGHVRVQEAPPAAAAARAPATQPAAGVPASQPGEAR